LLLLINDVVDLDCEGKSLRIQIDPPELATIDGRDRNYLEPKNAGTAQATGLAPPVGSERPLQPDSNRGWLRSRSI
jgi:hypothetical protein